MANLFRAFFFKLFKDLSFKIILIVGAGVAVLMTLLYMLIDGDGGWRACTGNNLFISSFNPAQNFGLAIPINLVTFTVTEFGFGIIRNKVVAGNSKVKIYLSLFLTGLVFVLTLLFAYVGFATLLGTIIGGFNEYGFGLVGIMSGNWGTFINPEFIWRFVVCNILVYISITAFAIFFATLFRNVGPTIPVVILVPVLLATVLPLISTIPDVQKAIGDVLPWINPFQAIGNPDSVRLSEYDYIFRLAITDEHMISTAVCCLGWTAIFVGFGTLIFAKRDIK